MILGVIVALAAATPTTVVATIEPSHQLIEGVATDGKRIWVSSLIDRQILACANRCTTLATLPAGLHPFALSWDATRKRLWVAADCPAGVPFIKACERGALIALDLRGRVRTRIAPLAGSFHPGDVSVAPGGELFVSDSQNGAVYRLLPSGQALKALQRPFEKGSAQGSALEAGGKRLIVADYGQGIAAIDLASGRRSILKRADGRPVRGIDGLVRCGSDYYAIYNGAPPGMLIRFSVTGDQIAFDRLIEGGVVADPTQIATDGRRLLIIGNSGWEKAMKGEGRREGAPILAVALASPCAN